MDGPVPVPQNPYAAIPAIDDPVRDVLTRKTMSDQGLKVGDVVRLKSGSPNMTIVGYVSGPPEPGSSIGTVLWQTKWMVGTEEFESTFPPAALVQADEIETIEIPDKIIKVAETTQIELGAGVRESERKRILEIIDKQMVQVRHWKDVDHDRGSRLGDSEQAVTLAAESRFSAMLHILKNIRKQIAGE
jgi:uncharacterized protein YodC (DUF2158 family)